MDKRSRLQIKVDALQRLLMNNLLSGILPLYIVTEYPKSGGTWVGQMLSEYLDIPFPRNMRPALKSSVMHCHYLYNPLLKNVVCVMRDGRDVMVSSYYHTLFQNDRSSPLLVRRYRKALQFSDYEDVRENMPAFIDYVFTSKKNSKTTSDFTWLQFVKSWHGKNVSIVKYEDLINDANAALGGAIRQLTGSYCDDKRLVRVIDKYSFRNQAKRHPGEENTASFLRKGVPGDWREKFSKKACEVFESHAGEGLRLLGYEKDSNWIK